MRHYPVIIVGGGPVGLCTAIGLRRLGIQCLLVERHASTSLFPKGRGISVRTMEIFRRWRFEHTVREAGLPPDQSLFIYTGETLLSEEFERFGRTEAQLSVPSPTSQLICSQDVLEPILKKQAVELGADVRFSTEAVSFAQDEDGVTVELFDAGGTSWSARCAYLVGADGAHSVVRHRLDIQMHGPGAVDTQSISILVEADLRDRVADRQSALYFVRRPAPGSLFAAVDNDRRWLLITRYSEEPPGGFAPEVCIELVRDAVGDRALDAVFVGHQLWQPTALVADRFRRGRVFLAGDAAHLTTPAGALGMNCGIADAHNLAWKLAAVIDGWAGSSLLDTYEPERKPVAHWCMQTSVDLRAEPEGPRRAGLFGVVLGYAYESSAVIGDGTDPPAPEDPVRTYVPTSRPGHRAPHVWLENDERQRSTLDLFGDGFVVLHSVDADVGGVRAAAADLTVPLRSYAVGSGGEIRDADGGVRSTYALGAKDAVLVRPDGHVAWRGDPAIGISDVLAAVVGRRGGGDRADSSSA